MRAVRRAIGAAAIVGLVGCFSNFGDYPVVSSCIHNTDCTGNQICLFRVCASPCLGDPDCPQPDGRCLKSGAGTACVTPKTAACPANACPAGTTCASNGTCQNSCAGGVQCLVGQKCGTDNTCEHDGAGGAAGTQGGGGASGSAQAGSGTGTGGTTSSTGGASAGSGGDQSAGTSATGGNSGTGGAGTGGAGTGGATSGAGMGGASGSGTVGSACSADGNCLKGVATCFNSKCVATCMSNPQCQDPLACESVTTQDGAKAAACIDPNPLALGLPCKTGTQCQSGFCAQAGWCAKKPCSTNSECGTYASCAEYSPGMYACYPRCQAANNDCALFGPGVKCVLANLVDGSTAMMCN